MKYKLLKSKKHSIQVGSTTLYRIQALKDFNNVKKGDLGGYIEKEANLSHEGNAWVFESAEVYGRARVYGDARVCEGTLVCEQMHIYNRGML